MKVWRIQLSPLGGFQALHVHLCADETVIITIDSRTGRLTLRDTGDLATGGRGIRFSAISEKLNENPTILLEALARLRISASIFPSIFGNQLRFSSDYLRLC